MKNEWRRFYFCLCYYVFLPGIIGNGEKEFLLLRNFYENKNNWYHRTGKSFYVEI